MTLLTFLDSDSGEEYSDSLNGVPSRTTTYRRRANRKVCLLSSFNYFWLTKGITIYRQMLMLRQCVKSLAGLWIVCVTLVFNCAIFLVFCYQTVIIAISESFKYWSKGHLGSLSGTLNTSSWNIHHIVSKKLSFIYFLKIFQHVQSKSFLIC